MNDVALREIHLPAAMPGTKKDAPENPVRRLDETLAARKPDLKYTGQA